MSKKKLKKLEEKPVEEEVAEVAAKEQTAEEETKEAPSQEETVKTKLEKLKPLPVTVPCSTCEADKKAYNIKIDKKGTFLFELECGHKEAFDFKVELSGEKAVADFGK